MTHLHDSLHTKRNDYPITEHPLAGVIAVLLLPPRQAEAIA